MARANQQEVVSAREGGGGLAGENRIIPSKALDKSQIEHNSNNVLFSTAFYLL